VFSVYCPYLIRAILGRAMAVAGICQVYHEVREPGRLGGKDVNTNNGSDVREQLKSSRFEVKESE
jgi:hypothetical protein